MIKLLIELVQVSLRNRNNLSFVPTKQEWISTYSLLKQHALIGICFNGINSLYDNNPEVLSNLPSDLKLQWIGECETIRKNNRILNSRSCELYSKLISDGLNACILKGQGLTSLYHRELQELRMSGDIDIWVNDERENVIEYVKHAFGFNGFDYKHLHTIKYKDVLVEFHYLPCISRNPFHNRRLMQFIKGSLSFEDIQLDGGVIAAPNIDFNVVFVLLHIFSHLFGEETSSKQYLDYYFVIKEFNRQGKDKEIAYKTICELGMGKFCAGVMWILVHYFGMSELLAICELNEAEGKFLMARLLSHINKKAQSHNSRIINKLSVLFNQTKKNIQLLNHYPSEVFWSPIWLLRHYIWKQFWKLKHRTLFT